MWKLNEKDDASRRVPSNNSHILAPEDSAREITENADLFWVLKFKLPAWIALSFVHRPPSTMSIAHGIKSLGVLGAGQMGKS